jgi:hypothetical protein
VEYRHEFGITSGARGNRTAPSLVGAQPTSPGERAESHWSERSVDSSLGALGGGTPPAGHSVLAPGDEVEDDRCDGGEQEAGGQGDVDPDVALSERQIARQATKPQCSGDDQRQPDGCEAQTHNEDRPSERRQVHTSIVGAGRRKRMPGEHPRSGTGARPPGPIGGLGTARLRHLPRAQ